MYPTSVTYRRDHRWSRFVFVNSVLESGEPNLSEHLNRSNSVQAVKFDRCKSELEIERGVSYAVGVDPF